MKYGLWIAQGLLAALFLFAGVMKLVTPVEQMTEQIALPGWFLIFIGVAEILGGIGLILPALLRIRPELTPLAAACLVVIMVGAALLPGFMVYGPAALIPLVVGALLAFVAYGRWRVAPRTTVRSVPSGQGMRAATARS